MRWKMAAAKQQLSAVVRAAQQEPQLIARRDELVAVVIGRDAFERYQALLQRFKKRTLAEAFAEVRQICEEEGYALELPPRTDRSNPMVELLDDVSR